MTQCQHPDLYRRGGTRLPLFPCISKIFVGGELAKLQASIIARTKQGDRLTPYVGAGVGYYFPDNEVSSDVNAAVISVFGMRIEEDIDESIGFHVLAGLAINVGQNVDLDLGVKYVILEPDVDVKATSITTFESVAGSEEIDLNTLFITAGLRLRF